MILLWILMFISNSYAQDTYVKYGIGIANSAKYGHGEVKVFGLGVTDKFVGFLPFAYQFEGGGWVDNIKYDGRKSSLYASSQLGVDIKGGVFKLSSMHGIGVISTTDAYLGSVPQFFHDICAGVVDDKNKASISLCYKHISNAGLFSNINNGRDLGLIKLQFPF